jgi:hypothetical protein
MARTNPDESGYDKINSNPEEFSRIVNLIEKNKKEILVLQNEIRILEQENKKLRGF